MKPEDFVSPKALTKLIDNRKKTVTNEKVEGLKIRWIRVSSDKPLQFSYRYTHNALEEWKVVDVKCRPKAILLILAEQSCPSYILIQGPSVKRNVLTCCNYWTMFLQHIMRSTSSSMMTYLIQTMNLMHLRLKVLDSELLVSLCCVVFVLFSTLVNEYDGVWQGEGLRMRMD